MKRLVQILMKNKTAILFILFVILCLSINLAKNFYPKLSGDAVSAVVMAKAPSMRLGVPYKDFWEYKPPGFFLLLDFWMRIFSSSMFSLRILQTLFLLGSGIFSYFILKRIFNSFFAFIIGGLAVIVFLSPYLNSVFLPSELFGLFFSLFGLVSLLYFKKLFWRFAFSSFLFSLSGQMKDPFMLTILAIIPPVLLLFLSRKLKSAFKSIIYALTGFIAAELLVFGYLFILGNFNSYLEVLAVKSRIFNSSVLLNPGETLERLMYAFWHAKNIILFFQYQTAPIIFLLILSFLLLFVLQKKVVLKSDIEKDRQSLSVSFSDLKIDSQTVNNFTIFFYSLGSFIGFALGNKFDFHYMLQIIFPLYFILTIILKSINDNLSPIFNKKLINLLLFLFLVFMIFPKGAYLKSYKLISYNPVDIVESVRHNVMAPDQPTKLENYISLKTKSSFCVLSVYGWSTGETYLNSHRRPCTRFFLANIVIEDWQKKEYRQSVLGNPPQAIVYSRDGADMNVLEFEQEVINVPKIINNCYAKDSQYKDLYFPRYTNNELLGCLKSNSL